jgi:hypothetical protein
VINLKLALLATGAVGAITAGGVAYAAVGSSAPATSAKPVADTAKKAVDKAVDKAAATLPTAAPTCVSLPHTKLPEAKLPKGELPKAEVPTDKLPKAGEKPGLPLPTDKVRLPGNLPVGKGNVSVPADKVKVPGALPTDKVKVPVTLPACAPGADRVAQAGQSGQTAAEPAPAAKPQLPTGKVPQVKLPSCSSVPPVIKVEKSKAKDITLPTGLHLAASHSHTITIQSGKICAMAQKFTAAGGKFLTVERLNTPPQVTIKELAAELKLPQGGLVSVQGTNAWKSPLGTGMLWISDRGYAIYLTGSPAYAAKLPVLAAQLQRLH